MKKNDFISKTLIASLICISSISTILAWADISTYDATNQSISLDAVQLSDGRQFAVELGLVSGNEITFGINSLSSVSNQNTNISFDLATSVLSVPSIHVNNTFYAASLLLAPNNLLSLSSLDKTGPFISQGEEAIVNSNLLANCAGSRVSGVGQVISQDGVAFTVPAETQYSTGTKATDLYNDCSGVKLSNINELNLDAVPVVEIDADGDIVSGYIFADNYFELYVNGVLVGVDPVPFTPFNSNVVRFKVKKPYTYAVKLVDWEENLGLGSENNRGNAYHAGDGGFIATFSDGVVTDAQWKAQAFYIAPLESASAIQELSDGTHSSSSATTSPSCDANCYAVHYAIPSDWSSKTYKDTDWPQATTYTNETVGVDNKPSFTNFADQFSAAQFIWSSNLVLDNVVLVRRVVN